MQNYKLETPKRLTASEIRDEIRESILKNKYYDEDQVNALNKIMEFPDEKLELLNNIWFCNVVIDDHYDNNCLVWANNGEEAFNEAIPLAEYDGEITSDGGYHIWDDGIYQLAIATDTYWTLFEKVLNREIEGYCYDSGS